MAHSCPDCGETCYCAAGEHPGFVTHELACIHCAGEDECSDDEDYFDDTDSGRRGECDAIISQGESHDPECPYA
jgi:hypothetical protein